MRNKLIVGAVVVAVVGVVLGGLPIGSWLLAVVDMVRGAGAVGVAGFAAVFLLVGVVCAPAAWPQMASGFLYGPLWGYALAWVLSLTSTWLNATLGRRFLRERVLTALEQRGGLAAQLEERLAERGTSLVVLLRLPPISPYHPLSYALGATRLSMRSILLGTAIGGLAPLAVYVFLGASVTELTVLLEGGDADAGATFWLTGVLTLVAVAAVTLRVRKELLDLEAGPLASPEDVEGVGLDELPAYPHGPQG